MNTQLYIMSSFAPLKLPLRQSNQTKTKKNNLENEEDNDGSQSPEREASAFLEECKKDAGKRRASLAAKMTSNLRRLSGAADLKIDINDPVSSNNPKYCNKKIKVSNRKNRKYQHTRLQAGRFDQ